MFIFPRSKQTMTLENHANEQLNIEIIIAKNERKKNIFHRQQVHLACTGRLAFTSTRFDEVNAPFGRVLNLLIFSSFVDYALCVCACMRTRTRFNAHFNKSTIRKQKQALDSNDNDTKKSEMFNCSCTKAALKLYK